jgi:glycosyltransferase
VGFLNSDDTFHDRGSLSALAAALAHADIAYGDLDMVADHASKALLRKWKAGRFGRFAFELGWQPPHPTFYMRRSVAERVGLYDLSYRSASDYDYMLRAMRLAGVRIAYVPQVIADFQLGGISTRDWRATVHGSIETLRSRRQHLRAPPLDAAIGLRLVRRLFQLRSPRYLQ